METSLNGHRKRVGIVRGFVPTPSRLSITSSFADSSHAAGPVLVSSVTAHNNPNPFFGQQQWPVKESQMVPQLSRFSFGPFEYLGGRFSGIYAQLPNMPFSGMVMFPSLNVDSARLPWEIPPQRGRDLPAALLGSDELGTGNTLLVRGTGLAGGGFVLLTDGFDVSSPEDGGGFVGCLEKNGGNYGNRFVRVQVSRVIKREFPSVNSSFPFVGASQLQAGGITTNPTAGLGSLYMAITVSEVQGNSETIRAKLLVHDLRSISLGLGRQNNSTVFVVSYEFFFSPGGLETSFGTVSFPYSPSSPDACLFGQIVSAADDPGNNFSVYTGTFDSQSLHPTTLETRNYKHGDLVDVAFQSSMVGSPDFDFPNQFSTQRSNWEFSEHPDRVVTQTIRGVDGRSQRIPDSDKAAKSPAFTYVPAEVQNIGERIFRIPTGQQRTRALTLAGIARRLDRLLIEDHADKIPVFPEDGRIHIGDRSFGSATLEFSARSTYWQSSDSQPSNPGWRIFTASGGFVELPEGVSITNQNIVDTFVEDFLQSFATHPSTRYQDYPFVGSVNCERFDLGGYQSAPGMLRATGQHISYPFSGQRVINDESTSWSMMLNGFHEVYCTFFMAIEGQSGRSGAEVPPRFGSNVRVGPVFAEDDNTVSPVLGVVVSKRTVLSLAGTVNQLGRPSINLPPRTTSIDRVGDSANRFFSDSNEVFTHEGNLMRPRFFGLSNDYVFWFDRNQTDLLLGGELVTASSSIDMRVGRQLGSGFGSQQGLTPVSNNNYSIGLAVRLT